jgi:sugar-specific transcriptional regulator TrmB
MDAEILKIRKFFQDVVSGFSVSHVKIYTALKHGEIKTAGQLSRETGIPYNKIYGVLRDLTNENIVFCTFTHPVNYYARDPVRTFNKLVTKKTLFLEKQLKAFKKMVQGTASFPEEKEYLIKFSETQTKLFDQKNKRIVEEPRETKQVIRRLHAYLKKIEPKKECGWVL